MKIDILAGTMYFSYDQGSLANLYPLNPHQVREILAANRAGRKAASLQAKGSGVRQTEFISAVGDDSITRFDEQKRRKKSNKGGGKHPRRRDNRPQKKNEGQK